MRDDKTWMDQAEDLLFTALLDSVKNRDAPSAKVWAEVLGKLGMV